MGWGMLRIVAVFGSGLVLYLIPFTAFAEKVFRAKYIENGEQRQLLESGWVPGQPQALGGNILVTKIPQTIIEHQPVDPTQIVEVLGISPEVVARHLSDRDILPNRNPKPIDELDEEVVTLVDSGPSDNRIDIVFMGDGYTAEERDRFFEDMERLTDDMFRGETFQSYLPLFNVHAVFRPSNVSGIGKNYMPKDTAYGLYRLGNTLRAILMWKPQVARNSCAKAPGCDYPIVVGNDDYYGGLGGEFAITTRSHYSGAVVLRHELGHNFGRVGEEYDGGGYFGENYSGSSSEIKWSQWLTDGQLKVQQAWASYVGWPWELLSQNNAFTVNFISNPQAGSFAIYFGASGIETDDTLEMVLDDQVFAIPSPGTKDRAFHVRRFDSPLPSGNHTLTFREKVHDGDNWLSDLAVYEYATDYDFSEDFYGAYPNFYRSGEVAGYRATHETCLMRKIISRRFCSVCQENNWMEFFDRVTLIDDVSVETEGQKVVVTYVGPNLDASPAGSLTIRWYRNGALVESLNGKKSWTAATDSVAGSWELSVEFVTEEIRKETVKTEKIFQIG